MIAVLFALATANFSPENDLAALTQGVQSVVQAGLPGVVSAISTDAVPFLAGDGPRAVAVAGRLEKGRVIAIGHDGYLSVAVAKGGDTARLFINMVNWTSRRKGKITVGTLSGSSVGLAEYLGFKEIHVTAQTLANADVVMVTGALRPTAVRDYVANGGGLIVAQTPWGWEQVHGANTLLGDFAWNGVLAEAGIVFSDSTVEHPAPVLTLAAANRVNAASALTRLNQDPAAAGVVIAALRDCPANTTFAKTVESVTRGVDIKVPTATNPVRDRDGTSRLAILLRSIGKSPSPKVDPSATSFPGPVPSTARRATKSVLIPVHDAQWASTGVYAAPGETISLSVPETLRDAGLTLQIGVHSDTLWHLDQWLRHPAIVVRTPIKGVTAELSSPFGGLVVIDVPRALGMPPQRVTLGNVIASPRFVLGETTVSQWQASLASDAPWAEFQSKHLILSVPTEEARKVQDPTAVMTLWDKVMDLYADLDGSPLTIRPERIVADRQISAGYMHSGYPIMTFMDDSVALSLSYKRLTTEGTWGHWHELGHNRQRPAWTFSGTGEVTNNVYVLRAMQTFAGKGLFDRIGSDKVRVDAYLAGPTPKFAKWQSDPFLALNMYAQLIDKFGWDSYRQVIRSYLNDPESALPKTDDEKHDQWMVRFSRQVRRNLAPFFDRWGVPVSADARLQVKELPEWKG